MNNIVGGKSNKPTGGPAFPGVAYGEPYTGMTLRDYFAAHASEQDIERYIETGEMESYTFYVSGTECEGERPILRSREQARYCYADAMIEARKS